MSAPCVSIFEYRLSPEHRRIIEAIIRGFVDGKPMHQTCSDGRSGIVANELPQLKWAWNWSIDRGYYPAWEFWFINGAPTARMETAGSVIWKPAFGVPAIERRCRWLANHFEWSIIHWTSTFCGPSLALV